MPTNSKELLCLMTQISKRQKPKKKQNIEQKIIDFKYNIINTILIYVTEYEIVFIIILLLYSCSFFTCAFETHFNKSYHTIQKFKK